MLASPMPVPAVAAWPKPTPVSATGLTSLKQLPNLRHLSLTRLGKLDDKAVEALMTLPALAELVVRDTGLSPKGLADLKKKEGLTVRTE